jgi:hypothetical protein
MLLCTCQHQTITLSLDLFTSSLLSPLVCLPFTSPSSSSSLPYLACSPLHRHFTYSHDHHYPTSCVCHFEQCPSTCFSHCYPQLLCSFQVNCLTLQRTYFLCLQNKLLLNSNDFKVHWLVLVTRMPCAFQVNSKTKGNEDKPVRGQESSNAWQCCNPKRSPSWSGRTVSYPMVLSISTSPTNIYSVSL